MWLLIYYKSKSDGLKNCELTYLKISHHYSVYMILLNKVYSGVNQGGFFCTDSTDVFEEKHKMTSKCNNPWYSNQKKKKSSTLSEIIHRY